MCFSFKYDDLEGLSIPGNISARGESPWETNEPNNHENNREYCVEIWPTEGVWNDIPCGRLRNTIVCQKLTLSSTLPPPV